MQDPTREEMLEFLNACPFADEQDEFDREEAIYWFASNYHGGQSSNLYSALSTSPYNPGPIARGPSDLFLYDELRAAFAGEQVE